jgi:hypothetical protein
MFIFNRSSKKRPTSDKADPPQPKAKPDFYYDVEALKVKIRNRKNWKECFADYNLQEIVIAEIVKVIYSFLSLT